ncbi:CDP-alcohol phosphatidyltransferase family protein [Oceanisphaera avium]|uniref:CDP-alcohol phosphatidyltransferase n=1 Tax=Oceanisphaera avium TaxID=1903694 RepID=A0A1Y0CXZ0_9GAMM|nr:CDP-alcohol phosphatidyltransferase family protein [Oceanisphaera avium]ART80181.1 CDP-alcohol phosphatidyltransferase [Oceanisphaera avium]
MISIYSLKPRFQNLLRPAVLRLAQRGVTANQVTLAAAGLSVLIALVVAWQVHHPWVFLLIPIWMLLRMALNAIDGMLAREYGQQSRLGAYLNELCDLVADSALYLPFALVAAVPPLLVIGVVLMAVLVEYAGVLGLMVGASRRYDGPMGKSDRAFVFGLLGLLVAINVFDSRWIAVALWLVLALLAYTLYHRVRKGLQEAKGLI